MHGESTNPRPALALDRGTLLLSGPCGKALLENADALWKWDERVSARRRDAIHYARIRQELADRFGQTWRDEGGSELLHVFNQQNVTSLREAAQP